MFFGNFDICPIFRLFFIALNLLDVFLCIFVLLVCFVLEIVISSAFIGFCVFFCIYKDISKISFYIFRKMSQKCEQFSYYIFWEDLGGFGGSPPHPHPWRQCQSSLPGGKIWKQMFFK